MIPVRWWSWLFVLLPLQQVQPWVLNSQSSVIGWQRRASRLAVSNNGEDFHNSESNNAVCSVPFRIFLEERNLPSSTCEDILNKLVEVQLLADKNSNAQNLVLLAQDFEQRPEVFSSILISDFGLAPLVAHQVRAVVMDQLKVKKESSKTAPSDDVTDHEIQSMTEVSPEISLPIVTGTINGVEEEQINDVVVDKHEKTIVQRPSFKSVVVNQRAKQRRSQKSSTGISEHHEYGLPANYQDKFPTVASELDEFYLFMTQQATSSQEATIRPATAKVYLKHSTLFLGWYLTTHNITVDSEASLYKIFPTKEKESAKAVLDFILWLRLSRNISVSYEANFLRGLTKLLKFRFSRESKSDPTYGDKSFDDIPLIREIRMLHREANKRQRLAPRSSDEKQKWLSWPEYLQVVQQLGMDLTKLIEKYKKENDPVSNHAKEGSTPEERKIAVLFQKYLVLAIFASVPDRQRTLRELEVGRSFQKDETSDCWCIKHAPEDYKTGKAYGERPLLQLTKDLTPWVDEFLEHWRQHLSPISDKLFAQGRTGKPLTQDSIYQIVSRECYNYAGKRTNPHLLRDMLVTHVRESSASEKELEALALYMGHSIQMQRTSYDRRTMTKKVAPAVQLMQSINDAGLMQD